ncbi:MAG: hypothetical protein KC503_43980, partial [Myxococcales bacterium]|nr:hypothetical protein [Myxococcales bacterium]
MFAQTTLWLLLTVMLAACGSGAVGGDPQGSTADSGSFDTGLATQQEACDGYDNDSDGEVDEGCPCVPGQTAQCYPGAPGLASVGLCAFGTMTCEGGSELGHWGPCLGAITPRVEVCGNGVDEDCDGKDACWQDLDGDGYGTAAAVTGDDLICGNAPGEAANT